MKHFLNYLSDFGEYKRRAGWKYSEKAAERLADQRETARDMSEDFAS